MGNGAEHVALAGNRGRLAEHVQTHALTPSPGVRASCPSRVHAYPHLYFCPACCCPDPPPHFPTPGAAAHILLSSVLQQLVQHLGLLGVVEVSGHQPLPHGRIGGHRGLSLHVQVPLQDGVVRWGWRGAWQVGWRWGRVLQAGGHSHMAQGLRGYGAQEVGVCRREGGLASETSLTWGPGHDLCRVSQFPPRPRPSLGAALPPAPRGRGVRQPRTWPLEAWAGRQAPVQGWAAFYPLLASSFPWAGLALLRRGGPEPPGSPEALLRPDPPLGFRKAAPGPPAQDCGSLLPPAAPLPGVQGPAPQPQWGGPSSLCSPGGIPEMFLVR